MDITDHLRFPCNVSKKEKQGIHEAFTTPIDVNIFHVRFGIAFKKHYLCVGESCKQFSPFLYLIPSSLGKGR